jgi:hypothetical protein
MVLVSMLEVEKDCGIVPAVSSHLDEEQRPPEVKSHTNCRMDYFVLVGAASL